MRDIESVEFKKTVEGLALFQLPHYTKLDATSAILTGKTLNFGDSYLV
jgi:hypothetical protein